MQLGHRVLKDMGAVLAAPYAAILTMVEVATRTVQYVPAVDAASRGIGKCSDY